MHGADALAAAPCTWGAEGFLGQRPNVPEAGMDVIKVPNMTQEEKWQARYVEVVAFIETNHRNSSKYVAEECNIKGKIAVE